MELSTHLVWLQVLQSLNEGVKSARRKTGKGGPVDLKATLVWAAIARRRGRRALDATCLPGKKSVDAHDERKEKKGKGKTSVEERKRRLRRRDPVGKPGHACRLHCQPHLRPLRLHPSRPPEPHSPAPSGLKDSPDWRKRRSVPYLCQQHVPHPPQLGNPPSSRSWQARDSSVAQT